MPGKILNKSLVRPFYRQNAGQFVFVIIFFGVVAPSQQLHYHHDLILGMLSAPLLFILVLLAWMIYNEKCARFILSMLQAPDYGFLDMLNRLEPKRLVGSMLQVQLLLSLPISLYSIAVTGVAIHYHWYLSACCVAGYILLLCFANVIRFRRQCLNPGKPLLAVHRMLFSSIGSSVYWPFAYWTIFIGYAIREQKFLLTGIKLFSCGILYLGVRSMADNDYDLRMPTLFYGIGLFGHGVLVYRFRELEEGRLLFYRGLPISLARRMVRYALLYLALMIPEIVTLGWLALGSLHYRDAFELLFSGYSFLLLLNSLLFIAPIRIQDYMKIVFCLFLLLYFCVLAGTLAWLAGFVLVIAVILFQRQYYRFEPAGEGF
jgi:hypothetical protein